jgi:hypothetical protein
MATKKKATTARKKSTTRHSTRRPLIQMQRDDAKFMSICMTRQTLYWAIFSIAILALGIWLVVLNLRIHELYAQVDQSIAAQAELDARLTRALQEKAD